MTSKHRIDTCSTDGIVHCVSFSSTDKVCDMCKMLIDLLESSEFQSDNYFAVQLAIEEAIVNAVKHGNHSNPSKKVTLSYSVSKEKLDIVISDEGEGFNPSAVPDPREDSNLCKTSGRGVFLMKSYMDFVEYNEQGNSVHMIKYSNKSSDTNSS